MSLLDIRIIGEPEAAAQAVAKLELLFDLDRCNGPYPSRKDPNLVRYYLTGRLARELTSPAPAADHGA